jgi:hypothetical protein
MITLVHRLSFIFAASIAITLSLAFVGTIEREEVYFFGIKFPAVCWFLETTGVECASCGLTRAWISVAHGEFDQAIAYNKNAISTFSAATFGFFIFFYIFQNKNQSYCRTLFAFAVAIIIIMQAWYPIVKENIFLFDAYT